MSRKTLACFGYAAACIVLFVSIGGCTHVLDSPRVVFSDYPNNTKIELPVALRLTNDFKSAKSERIQNFDTFIIPLGDHLVVNAEAMTRAIFSQVTILKDNSEPKDARFRAIVVPRLISSQRVSPVSAFIKQTLKIAVALEWAVYDQADNLLWIDTITAEGKLAEPTYSFEGNRKNLMESLIQDLFQKSYERIFSSPEIGQFAEQQTRP